MWKVTHIYDDDYGCEERMPGEKKKAILYVVNDDGVSSLKMGKLLYIYHTPLTFCMHLYIMEKP